MQMTRRAKLLRFVVLPLLVYTPAVLFITWPLAVQLSTHVAGAGYGDSFEYVRLGWWGRYALQHGLNPFYQSLFGYPDGFFSAVQWAQPLIYWPTALLGFVFSPVTALNLWLLLEIILSGLTACWLCLYVLDTACTLPDGAPPMLAALFGGLVFMAFPATQGHLSAGHVNPLSNYALPVLALCLYRLVEGQGGVRTALTGAAALLVMALGNFTFPAFALLPVVLFGGIYLLLFRRDRLFNRTLLRNLALLFGVGGLLIAPFYLPLFNDLTAPNRPAYLQETGWVQYSADPLAFIAPSPFTPWLSGIVPAYSRTVLGTNSIEGTAYLGLVAVLLAAVAVWRCGRKAGLWLTIALGCMVFSLGPLLKWQDQPVVYRIGEYSSNVALPWALFQNLPLINGTRTPGRFNMTTGLALGVLAALGLSIVLCRIGRRNVQAVLAGVLIVITLAEYQLFFPFPTTPAALPAYFAALAGREDVRAVLDVPQDDLLAQKAALYQQTAHHKPLIAGYISRRTPIDAAKLAVLSDVALGKLPEIPGQSTLSADDAHAVLKASGVDVVVFHLQLLDPDNVIEWATGTFGQAKYRDDQLAIFEVPQATTAATMPITLSVSGWWRRQSGDATPWMTGESNLYLYTASAADHHWALRLSPLLHARQMRLTVDGRLSRAWTIGTPAQALDFWLRLDPGFHTLTFTLPDGCTPVPAAPACLLYNVDSAERTEQNCTLKADERNVCVSMALNDLHTQDAGSMAFQPHPVRLSNGMALQGFRVPQTGQIGHPLPVETDWQASQKLPGDYHLFVHVLDQNGKMVTQADTIPGSGTFPTANWSAHQDWVETLDVPLPPDLAPGKYSVYAGWYSYPDLTRLSVEGNAPHAADGLVYLREVEVR
jgi:hypothetical protein